MTHVTPAQAIQRLTAFRAPSLKGRGAETLNVIEWHFDKFVFGTIDNEELNKEK